MKTLIYLILFPFDYLFDGNVIYILAVLAGIAALFVLIVFLVRVLIREGFLRIGSSTESTESINLSSLKQSIDGLRDRQDVLIERFASVQEVLRGMQVELARLKRDSDPPPHDHIPLYDEQDRDGGRLRSRYANVSSTSSSTPGYYSQDTEDGRAESSDMTDLYNVSRTDQSSRELFREKYRPFFINVANDIDRRRDESLPPDFRKEANGSYLAVPGETDEAMIFPNFTLAVVDAVYGPGALAEVFDCSPFDRRFSYQNIRVLTPATFKLSGGQSWRVTQKGKLDLGSGQDA